MSSAISWHYVLSCMHQCCVGQKLKEAAHFRIRGSKGSPTPICMVDQGCGRVQRFDSLQHTICIGLCKLCKLRRAQMMCPGLKELHHLQQGLMCQLRKQRAAWSELTARSSTKSLPEHQTVFDTRRSGSAALTGGSRMHAEGQDGGTSSSWSSSSACREWSRCEASRIQVDLL